MHAVTLVPLPHNSHTRWIFAAKTVNADPLIYANSPDTDSIVAQLATNSFNTDADTVMAYTGALNSRHCMQWRKMILVADRRSNLQNYISEKIAAVVIAVIVRRSNEFSLSLDKVLVFEG
jgi:hypothetical protein